MILTPWMPVPGTNGEEWDRLEAATGIDALLELIMQGEYNGQDALRRQKESVDLRATAVGVFEVCVPSLVLPLRSC
jgi:intracellular protein transport protein USO1